MCYFIVCPSRFVWCWQEYHRTDVISFSVNNTMGCLFIPLVVLLIIITIIKWYLSSLKVKLISHVRLFATPWTVAYQAPQYMEFSRQEYWSGLLFPSPGDLPNPGIEPRFPALQADALPSEPQGSPSIVYLLSLVTCGEVLFLIIFLPISLSIHWFLPQLELLWLSKEWFSNSSFLLNL